MPPRIVFLALCDSSHGRYILHELIHADMAPCAVFIGSRRSTITYRYRSILRYLRAHGLRETAARMLYRATQGKDVLQGRKSDLTPGVVEQAQKHAIPVEYFNAINDDRTVEAVRSYHPDFIVLGSAPLLKQGIREVPRYGVVNAHPAKLPEVRGMDVVGWSILQGVPPGLTVFFVDAGVDTGPILCFHPVADTMSLTLEGIMEKLQAQAGKAIVSAIQGFLSGTLKPVPQQKADGKLYRAMPRATRARVKAILRTQAPSRLRRDEKNQRA